MTGSGFAVIDFETTGLFSGGHDRVIEVAVARPDARSRATSQWETLVNTRRDLGWQDIHRVRAADVMIAPGRTLPDANFLRARARARAQVQERAPLGRGRNRCGNGHTNNDRGRGTSHDPDLAVPARSHVRVSLRGSHPFRSVSTQAEPKIPVLPRQFIRPNESAETLIPPLLR